MSSVSDIVVDGVSTTSIDAYSVSTVSDVTTDGVSTTSVDAYYMSSVLDVGVDGVSYAYVDVAEQQAAQVGGGVSLPWYVWAFMTLFVIDMLASRRGR